LTLPIVSKIDPGHLWNRSLLVTAAAVGVVSTISVGVAWNASADLSEELSVLTMAPILAAAFVSYLLRVLRFYYFLSRSGIPISLGGTLLVQAVGFALSVTPGHVGEIFKLRLIQERTGTPVVQTVPLLLLERLTEGSGFLVLAILSGLMLPALRARVPVPALTLIGLTGACVFAVTLSRRGRNVNISRWLAGSPLWERLVPHLRHLWHGLVTSFTLPQILGGLILSAVARFADGLVVLLAADVMGLELTLPTAVFVLAVSGLAGGISFLPAGIGAVETAMVSLLVLLGADWSDALAISLLARLSTLWLWVAVGLVLVFVLRLFHLQMPLEEDSGR
jgi:uncharacterized protein (TIRG00374 family)